MKKKLNLTDEQVVRDIVNYMLRYYDADYEYVKKHSKIKGVDWFHYYWDDTDSKSEWFAWTVDYLKNNVNCKKFTPEEVAIVIDTMYGLIIY